MFDALQKQIPVQNQELCLILACYEAGQHGRGAFRDAQFCDSLLHRANITCNILLKVMHKLSKFTSETVRKATLAIVSDQGDDQPLFWHLQDWHQDK